MENHPDTYPVHPNIHLNDISSLPEGRGAFWNWGPNYTADPIVLTTEDRPQVLLIRRQDNNMLALPGGFVDETDGLNNSWNPWSCNVTSGLMSQVCNLCRKYNSTLENFEF